MTVVELVILFMIAAFILLQLRRELGKKQGDEDILESRRNEQTQVMREQMSEPASAEPAEDPVIALEADPVLRRAYQDIRSADGVFTPSQFLEGAGAAYGMILEGYWQGDKTLLKEFLDDDLYDQFAGAVDSRVDAGQVMDNKLENITDLKISAARMHGSSAEVTIDVKADVRAVTRDGEGNILDGDDNATVEYNDRWTFARNTRSDDPNWTLVATAAL